MKSRGTPGTDVLIAVAGQSLAQEAVAVVAATGYHPVQVTTPDPAGQLWWRAAAVLIDVPTSRFIADDAGGNGDTFRSAGRREMTLIVHEDGEQPDLRVALEVGAEGVFALPSEGADLVERIGRPGRGAPGGGGSVIACIGSVGGAGTSVVAAACAAKRAQEGETLLIDADELSGGTDLLLGIEHVPGLRWPDIRTGGSIDADALRAALPTVSGGPADSLGVVTGPRSRSSPAWDIDPGAVRSLVDAMVCAGGTAVVDLPRSGAALDLVPPQLDVLAMVVPTSVRGIAAASRQSQRLREHGTEPVVVLTQVETGGVGAEEAEYATGLEVVATVPNIRRLGREIEATGIGARSFRRLVEAVAPVVDRTGPVGGSRTVREVGVGVER